MQKAGEEERVFRAGVLCSWSVRMSCYLIALEYVGLNESFLMNNRQMHKSQTPSTQMVKQALMKTWLGWQVGRWFVKRREYISFEMIFVKSSKSSCCPCVCCVLAHNCSCSVPLERGSRTEQSAISLTGGNTDCSPSPLPVQFQALTLVVVPFVGWNSLALCVEIIWRFTWCWSNEPMQPHKAEGEGAGCSL